MCEIIKIGSFYNCRGRKLNRFKMVLDESLKYEGDHPLEFRDHYENILESRGEIEMSITDIKFENGKLVIYYEEQ